MLEDYEKFYFIRLMKIIVIFKLGFDYGMFWGLV